MQVLFINQWMTIYQRTQLTFKNIWIVHPTFVLTKGSTFYQNTFLIKKYKKIKQWSVSTKLTLVAATGNQPWIVARSIKMTAWLVEITG